MREHCANIDHRMLEIYSPDKSIVISVDIEYGAFAHEISMSIRLPNIREVFPFRLPGDSVPRV